MTNDTVRRNKAGAVIHDDVNEHRLLEIPYVTTEEDGFTYEVLSAGYHEKEHIASVEFNRYTTTMVKTPIVTIQNKGASVEAYRLPKLYIEWVNMLHDVVRSGGKPFPNKVTFGVIDGNIFANFK